MHTKIQVLLTGLVVLAFPASASANFAHVVAKGESLSSVAATDGLSVDQLAAANGLSPDAQLITGATLQIPPQSAAAVTPSSAAGDESQPVTSEGAAPAGGGGYVVQPGDTLSAIAAANGMTVDQLAAANGLTPSGLLIAGTTLSLGSSSASSSASVAQSAPSGGGGGGYVVQPGDTLSAIAAAGGTTVDQLAAANGLSPSGLLLAGTTLTVPGVSASSGSGSAGGGAQPTPESVSPSDVGAVAAANGVPPSLAEAIGYQESGFNNDLVSSTGATGVMQIEPGTWSYIERNLSGPLSSASAQDNVRGGVLLLRSLLQETGGDVGLAAAGYYQGLQSVREHGLYRDTRRYVADVTALQSRFGGP